MDNNKYHVCGTLYKTCEVVKENKRLKTQVKNLEESSRISEKRWLKALKEQGFKVGAALGGHPDIRE